MGADPHRQRDRMRRHVALAAGRGLHDDRNQSEFRAADLKRRRPAPRRGVDRLAGPAHPLGGSARDRRQGPNSRPRNLDVDGVERRRRLLSRASDPPEPQGARTTFWTSPAKPRPRRPLRIVVGITFVRAPPFPLETAPRSDNPQAVLRPRSSRGDGFAASGHRDAERSGSCECSGP